MVALASCSSGNDVGEDAPKDTPLATTAAPTEAPRDPEAPVAAYTRFVEAVQAGNMEAAWNLYAASVPDDTSEHRRAVRDWNGSAALWARPPRS